MHFAGRLALIGWSGRVTGNIAQFLPSQEGTIDIPPGDHEARAAMQPGVEGVLYPDGMEDAWKIKILAVPGAVATFQILGLVPS